MKTGLWKANNQEVTFTMNCENPMFAELLERKLNNQLEELVESIRKQEYELGVKDGRAKRKKRDYFFVMLEKRNY
jgi:hypothetical protein